MDNLNYVFFEEFKRLDRLCCDLLGVQHGGVTEYIDTMKRTEYQKSCCIFGWEDDLKKLIRLRHVRNNLAHDAGAFFTENCAQADVEWLQNFYQRILRGDDPICSLRRTRYATKPSKTVKATPKKDRKQRDRMGGLAVLITTGIALLIALIWALV